MSSSSLRTPPRSSAARVRTVVASLVVVAAGAHAAAAHAQTGLAIYGGYRSGSGFQQTHPPQSPVDLRSSGAVSFALEQPYDGSRLWQWFLSHQRTRLELGPAPTPGAPTELPLQLTYLHVGGINYFDGGVGRGPYVAGGVGLTHMNPSLQGTSSRVRGSLSIALGYQWPLAGSAALRTELRGYATLIRSDGSFFCSGGCTISIKGDTMTQVEAMIGLTAGF